MAYSYQPRDPRGKLREIVTRYITSMRVTGRAPNRAVVFGEDHETAAEMHTSGWLLGDRRPGAAGERYLLLEDGDVWRAKKSTEPSAALDVAVATWLEQPDDNLVTLLAKSLGDARLGGTGWMEEGDGIEAVADRRAAGQPHGGPDRRRRSLAAG